MISLQKIDNVIKFTFQDNDHYLQNGVIEVPINSLSLVTDDSQMFTFKKSATNDIFVSGLYSEIGMTKAELETFYKDNMVGSTGGGGGIDSGAVESIVEDYMTDPNYIAYSALTGELQIGTSGNTRFTTENNYFKIGYNSVASQGYVVPNSGGWGSTTYNGEKSLYIQGINYSDDFCSYVSSNGVNGSKSSEGVLLFALKSEYASAITQTYKNYNIWYGFNEIPTKPKSIDEIDGIVQGSNYLAEPTSFNNVSGSTYLVMNVFVGDNPRQTMPLGAENPLDFSGIDFSDDMYKKYISCDGTDIYNPLISNHTVIGFYLIGQEFSYNYQADNKFFVMPLSNRLGFDWDYYSNSQKITYNLQMDKQYDGDNMTDLYNKVSSAQTTANSGLSVANQALYQANANRNDIVQVDWNQNDSGSTNYDYIKNRPMWKEKSYSDSNKIYESEPIYSFNLDNYEIALDSPLAVGDDIRVGYSSRYGGQVMFTDTVKVNSGNVPSGSYYCGSYDPMGWNSNYMWSNDLQTWYVCSQRFDYEAALYIIKAADVYHKLDSNYIDDDIQRTLSAGTNITISGNVISATGGGGGGGMDEDTELLLSTALVDLNDRKIDASEVKSNYQEKGDYATKKFVTDALEPYETKLDGQNVEEVTSYALNELNQRLIALEEAVAALQALHNNE